MRFLPAWFVDEAKVSHQKQLCPNITGSTHPLMNIVFLKKFCVCLGTAVSTNTLTMVRDVSTELESLHVFDKEHYQELEFGNQGYPLGDALTQAMMLLNHDDFLPMWQYEAKGTVFEPWLKEVESDLKRFLVKTMPWERTEEHRNALLEFSGCTMDDPLFWATFDRYSIDTDDEPFVRAFAKAVNDERYLVLMPRIALGECFTITSDLVSNEDVSATTAEVAVGLFKTGGRYNNFTDALNAAQAL